MSRTGGSQPENNTCLQRGSPAGSGDLVRQQPASPDPSARKHPRPSGWIPSPQASPHRTPLPPQQTPVPIPTGIHSLAAAMLGSTPRPLAPTPLGAARPAFAQDWGRDSPARHSGAGVVRELPMWSDTRPSRDVVALSTGRSVAHSAGVLGGGVPSGREEGEATPTGQGLESGGGGGGVWAWQSRRGAWRQLVGTEVEAVGSAGG